MAIQDPRDETPVGTCSGCGHTIGAHCSECGREFLCGSVSTPCRRDGCAERVLSQLYGGADSDLKSGPVEAPRRSVRGDV